MGILFTCSKILWAYMCWVVSCDTHTPRINITTDDRLNPLLPALYLCGQAPAPETALLRFISAGQFCGPAASWTESLKCRCPRGAPDPRLFSHPLRCFWHLGCYEQGSWHTVPREHTWRAPPSGDPGLFPTVPASRSTSVFSLGVCGVCGLTLQLFTADWWYLCGLPVQWFAYVQTALSFYYWIVKRVLFITLYILDRSRCFVIFSSQSVACLCIY